MTAVVSRCQSVMWGRLSLQYVRQCQHCPVACSVKCLMSADQTSIFSLESVSSSLANGSAGWVGFTPVVAADRFSVADSVIPRGWISPTCCVWWIWYQLRHDCLSNTCDRLASATERICQCWSCHQQSVIAHHVRFTFIVSLYKRQSWRLIFSAVRSSGFAKCPWSDDMSLWTLALLASSLIILIGWSSKNRTLQ